MSTRTQTAVLTGALAAIAAMGGDAAFAVLASQPDAPVKRTRTPKLSEAAAPTVEATPAVKTPRTRKPKAEAAPADSEASQEAAPAPEPEPVAVTLLPRPRHARLPLRGGRRRRF